MTTDEERDRHGSPARRGWMGGISGAPPAGPGWRAGRFPPFTSYVLGGMVTAVLAILLFFLIV